MAPIMPSQDKLDRRKVSISCSTGQITTPDSLRLACRYQRRNSHEYHLHRLPRPLSWRRQQMVSRQFPKGADSSNPSSTAILIVSRTSKSNSTAMNLSNLPSRSSDSTLPSPTPSAASSLPKFPLSPSKRSTSTTTPPSSPTKSSPSASASSLLQAQKRA